jgi:hypothetical protein
VGNDCLKTQGIFLEGVIACPVCGGKASSFRVRKGTSPLSVAGEFYHKTATCVGSLTPEMLAAIDLPRLQLQRLTWTVLRSVRSYRNSKSGTLCWKGVQKAPPDRAPSQDVTTLETENPGRFKI